LVLPEPAPWAKFSIHELEQMANDTGRPEVERAAVAEELTGRFEKQLLHLGPPTQEPGTTSLARAASQATHVRSALSTAASLRPAASRLGSPEWTPMLDRPPWPTPEWTPAPEPSPRPTAARRSPRRPGTRRPANASPRWRPPASAFGAGGRRYRSYKSKTALVVTGAVGLFLLICVIGVVAVLSSNGGNSPGFGSTCVTQQGNCPLIQINSRSPVHPYLQLAAQLREQIESGQITSQLPSITELRAQTGLAVRTVRHAIKVLIKEGLVRTVPGRGTFVTR
jgi:hypothetical protein